MKEFIADFFNSWTGQIISSIIGATILLDVIIGWPDWGDKDFKERLKKKKDDK